VELSFPIGEKLRHARWNYNPPLRQVNPLDDESRWLTDGDGRERESRAARESRGGRPENTSGRSAETGPRLVVAPDPRTEPDAATPDGRDLLDSLVETEQGYTPSLELLDSLRERRGRRVRPVSAHDADREDAEADPVESAIEAILLRPGQDGPEPGAGGTRNGSTRPAVRSTAETSTTSAGSEAPTTSVTSSPSATSGPSTSTRAGGSTSTRAAQPATKTGSAPTAQTGAKRGSRRPVPKPPGNGSHHPAGRALVRDGRTPGAEPYPPRTVAAHEEDVRAPQRTLEVPMHGASAADLEREHPQAERAADSAATVSSPEAPAADPVRAATPARKNRRASVPSWDEIILGARRD
jgi:hypothetical protein